MMVDIRTKHRSSTTHHPRRGRRRNCGKCYSVSTVQGTKPIMTESRVDQACCTHPFALTLPLKLKLRQVSGLHVAALVVDALAAARRSRGRGASATGLSSWTVCSPTPSPCRRSAASRSTCAPSEILTQPSAKPNSSAPSAVFFAPRLPIDLHSDGYMTDIEPIKSR